MGAITKFKEAAIALQSDEVYTALQQARIANDADEALQEAINEFTLQRLNLNNEMEKTEKDSAKIAELNQTVNELYGQIMSNSNMQAFDKAKADVEAFIGYVNEILNAAIAGQDPMEVEPPLAKSCGAGGCSSCSGCG